ncbi:TBC1 domain family member 22B [Episyrphus balteatus]|uniref:TBC1 domain family member 22B n=1 Tax=Episyrphus balteatus TaxID=286459 RepID=UPI0024851AF7|nr:TBC1 domain family member 22B [Episyrphus balteatus]
MEKADNSKSFWKSSSRIVPGRPSPNVNLKMTNPTKSFGKKSGDSTFKDYQMSVSDAWDMGDDECCILEKSHNSQQQQQQQNATNPTEAAAHETPNAAAANNHAPATECQEQLKSSAANYENRCRNRRFDVYPGWPQLQKLSSTPEEYEDSQSKINKLSALIESPFLDFADLKQISWSGIPKQMRAITWRLLSKYLPPNGERRTYVLQSKRQSYCELRRKYFMVDSKDESQQDTYRQIHIDVPRMNPHNMLFKQELVQEMFERILFIWAIRHPASGYVQGINDLVTPFFIVFLQEAFGVNGFELEKIQFKDLSEDVRHAIEADSFWCLSNFLDCIQDNYIFAQLGIQEKVNQLKDLIHRIDGTLHRHLQDHGIDYLQFSFRWMNNLLTRELPLHCTIRLWDTYLAESDGFAQLHLYVCAAFLLHWRTQLLNQTDFQGLMIMLQNLPTYNWSDRQINILVAEAFRLKFTYADTPKHLEAKS